MIGKSVNEHIDQDGDRHRDDECKNEQLIKHLAGGPRCSRVSGTTMADRTLARYLRPYGFRCPMMFAPATWGGRNWIALFLAWIAAARG